MEIRLLGPVECRIDDAPISIPGTSANAVLAMLGLRVGSVVLTDEIVAGLWGADFPNDPTAAIHVTISRLRRALGRGRERLRSVPHGYVLDLEMAQVDVNRAQAALDEGRSLLVQDRPVDASEVLCAGLAEWHHDSPLMELADLPFAAPAASRLHVLRAALVELANDTALAIGRPEDVIARSEALLAADPWSEGLVRQLMVARYQTGHQAEALVAYAALASRLHADFGTEPSPELESLRSRILSHAPEVRRQRPTEDDGSMALPQWFQSTLDALGHEEEDLELRCRLRLALGEAQHHAGLPGWQDTLHAAGELATATGDPALVARCALGGALGWSVTGVDPDERRLRLLSAALDHPEQVGDEIRARLLAAYATELTFSADLDERLRTSDRAVAIARATGTPTLLLSVLNQRFNAIWAPETLDLRLRDSDEASELAAATEQPLAQEVATGFAMAASLEAADMVATDRHLARFVALADELGLPVFAWGAKLHRSWRAVLADELDEAEWLAEAARWAGIEANRPEAEVVYLCQRIAIRWAQGRLAEELDPLRQLCDAPSARPWWRAAHALGVFLGGDVRGGRARLIEVWQDGAIGTIPRDQLSLSSLLLCGELAAALHEVDIARDLISALAPNRDLFCFTGAAVFGPTAHGLGLLHDIVGDRSAATGHLRRSVALSQTMGTPFFARRSQAALDRLQ